MLVAISGSQGSGKSTLIRQFEDAGYKSIERKTARSVLADWSLTLEEVYSDPTLTMRYQHELLDRKYADELTAANDIAQVFFTERTYADLFGYALAYLGPRNDCADWLEEYFQMCNDCNHLNYRQVFFLTAGHFTVEHDGVRSTSRHFSRMMDLTMRDLTEQMVNEQQLTLVSESDLDKRVEEVKRVLTQRGMIPQGS